MRLKPQKGDRANCGLRIGNHLAGWVDAVGRTTRTRSPDGDAPNVWHIVHKGSDGVWYCGVALSGASGSAVPFGEYDGGWHDLRVRYNTAEGDYDLYMDGRLVLKNAPTNRDMSVGVSWVALYSGRWGREEDEPSLFDDFRVYVEPFDDT